MAIGRALVEPGGPGVVHRAALPELLHLAEPGIAQRLALTGGELELAAVGKSNGFSDLFQGAVVPKGSELGGVLKDAIKVLVDNGTYAAVMKKWGLENNKIEAPGINLSQN